VQVADLDFVLNLIEAARLRAVASVNTTLIELYWSVSVRRRTVCVRMIASGTSG
jgi:hypothetical protein